MRQPPARHVRRPLLHVLEELFHHFLSGGVLARAPAGAETDIGARVHQQ